MFAARSRVRRVEPARFRRKARLVLSVQARVSRQGVIRRYREWLPEIPDDAIATIGEGETPLIEATRISERVGRPPVLEVRGDEPDGLVQGPRHDGGHEQGRRNGEPRLRLRLDGEHGGLGRGLRGAGRHGVFRRRARGQDRVGQGRTGPRARGADRPDRGQLRRGAQALARGSPRSSATSRWSTR